MPASLLDGHPTLSKVFGLCGELFAEDFVTPSGLYRVYWCRGISGLH